ncbi:hypothetical protein EVAR_76004_1 [Eumeta japonica]|uniref:Uncharacterized protein n=1 Tax=Eumeta variegata TaxID=151549 RepID=A0A4C1UB03_EUMVA|nr:hypothetical protein EVAR_76004_1 [Eumeta japonica]
MSQTLPSQGHPKRIDVFVYNFKCSQLFPEWTWAFFVIFVLSMVIFELTSLELLLKSPSSSRRKRAFELLETSESKLRRQGVITTHGHLQLQCVAGFLDKDGGGMSLRRRRGAIKEEWATGTLNYWMKYDSGSRYFTSVFCERMASHQSNWPGFVLQPS